MGEHDDLLDLQIAASDRWISDAMSEPKASRRASS
jgi:hypothetical protein